MTIPVLHGLWRRCPLHQVLGKLGRSADFRKESPMIKSDYRVRADSRQESTLLPMLIAGLVTVVVGVAVAAFFV
jgi:hypothetical protein